MANRLNGKKNDSRRDSRVPSAKSAKLLYLYGITDHASNLGKLEGVDGVSPVEAVECAGFFCWVSRVDPKEYGENLQARMENLDWLAAASVRHQKIVGAIHEQTTILPARFATVFLSEQTLTADVTRRARELKKDFDRLSGADEYGVKIFGIPQAAMPGEAPKSGRDYLAKKSEMLREQTPTTVTREVKEFIANLRGLASQVVEGGSVTSGQRNLLWQGSFLLPRDSRKKLETALSGFHGKHSERYRVECTGPWPPYSFVASKAQAKA